MQEEIFKKPTEEAPRKKRKRKIKNSDIVPEIIKVCSFPGGRSSGKMLSMIKDDVDLILFANTGKEAPGTLDFVRNCEVYFGVDIVWVEYDPINKFKVVNYDTASRNGEPFEALIKKRKYTPNAVTRFCTTELKIRPMLKFLQSQGIRPVDVEMSIGIRADEPKRFKLEGIAKGIGWDRVLPLKEAEVTEADVNLFWKTMPFDLEIANYQGNCDLCFLKGQSKRIRLLREQPEIAEWWMRMEEITGGTFTKFQTIAELLHISKTQQVLFEDDDVDCFCTID